MRPRWIALDSAGDGYDVLSQLSAEDRRRLTIEVKASERALKYAEFYLTRNEWETEEDFLNHVFHLWDLSGEEPRLATLLVEQLRAHIPTDNGNGNWKSTSVPFGAFDRQFESVVNN